MPAPTSYSAARCSWPPSTIAALAVVPPMSRVIRSRRGMSARRARSSAAITPAAGPDSTMWMGRSLAARDQRRRLGPGQVVQPRVAHPPQLEGVAEAARSQQPGPRALAFEDGVGADSGAVDDLLDHARGAGRQLREEVGQGVADGEA